MTVTLPHDLDPQDLAQLKVNEKKRSQELQADGRWKYIWRVVGRFENYSVFDVSSHDELHDMLSSLPFWPYMDITVIPLATHPSDIRANPAD